MAVNQQKIRRGMDLIWMIKRKKIRSYVDIYYEAGAYELTMVREEGASAKSLDRPRMNEIIAMIKGKQVENIFTVAIF